MTLIEDVHYDRGNPFDPDQSLPVLTAMGLVTRDNIHPGGIAVCRLIGEKVFPLVAELLPDEMPHHEAWAYAGQLQRDLGVYRVMADVTSAGRDAREDIAQALGRPNVQFVSVQERVSDADAEVPNKKPLREITSRFDWLLDHGLYVRLGREHPAEIALSNFAARRTRPEEDEQKFERDESDSLVIPIAGACHLLNVDRFPTVSVATGSIRHPETLGVKTAGFPYVDTRQAGSSPDDLWEQMRAAREHAWETTRGMGITNRSRPLF